MIKLIFSYYKVEKSKLTKFIETAFTNCYGGEFKRAETRERHGFFEMEYADGKWHYRDSFTGYYRSAGQEIIRYDGKPVWSRATVVVLRKSSMAIKTSLRNLKTF